MNKTAISKVINFLFAHNDILVSEINKIKNAQAAAKVHLQTGVEQFYEAIDSINQILAPLDDLDVSSIDLNDVEESGLQYFMPYFRQQYFNSKKNQVATGNSSAVIDEITSTYSALNNTLYKIRRSLPLLDLFLVEDISFDAQGEGIIEIVFKEAVSIDNISDAKEQINDWFLILDGYASALGIRREDFEIISITKSSPTRIKIKAALTNIGLFLSVVTSLLAIEKSIFERTMLIEKLQANPLTDKNFQQQFIDSAKKSLETIADEKINEIIDEKLKERGIDNGAIKTSFKKSIERQYNFIINGGEVYIQINNGEYKKELDTLANTKKELRKLKDESKERKAIDENNNNSTDTTLIDQPKD